MNEFKTDVRTGLQYELQGDYYVIAGEREEKPVAGIWGQRHLRWLKQNRRVTYTNLLTSGKLYEYLREIDTQTRGQLDALITKIARAEGVTEQFKAENQLEWVRRMNSIKDRAEEIVLDELIYC